MESPAESPAASLICLNRSMSMLMMAGRMRLSDLRERQGRADAIEEELAVRQAGQIVMHGVVQ